jgi:hypothetical protein
VQRVCMHVGICTEGKWDGEGREGGVNGPSQIISPHRIISMATGLYLT